MSALNYRLSSCIKKNFNYKKNKIIGLREGEKFMRNYLRKRFKKHIFFRY